MVQNWFTYRSRRPMREVHSENTPGLPTGSQFRSGFNRYACLKTWTNYEYINHNVGKFGRKGAGGSENAQEITKSRRNPLSHQTQTLLALTRTENCAGLCHRSVIRRKTMLLNCYVFKSREVDWRFFAEAGCYLLRSLGTKRQHNCIFHGTFYIKLITEIVISKK